MYLENIYVIIILTNYIIILMNKKNINNKSTSIVHKMWINFLFIFTVLITISLWNFIFTQYHISFEKANSVVINISGQQRMLTQRIGFLTEGLILTSDTLKQEKIISELRILVNQFERNHSWLINGDTSKNIPAASIPEVLTIYYNTPHYLDKQVKSFIQHTNRLIEASKQKIPEDSIEVQYIISTILNNELLNSLNLVVTENEATLTEQIQLLKLVNIIVLISNILGFLLVGIFLFIPLLKVVSKQFDAAIYQNKILSEEIKHREAIKDEKEKLEIRYKSIISNLPIGVFRLKLWKNSKIITWNNTFLKLLWTEKEKITSKNVLLIDYFKNNNTKKLFTEFKNKLKPQKLSDIEIVNEKWKKLWVNIWWKVIEENNELFFDGSLDDVSETHKIHELLEKSYAQLQKADLMKDEIIWITSHELRTPLTIIKWFASMLEDSNLGNLNHEQHKYVNKIVDNTDKMLMMINDMLDLSKLEAWETVFVPEEINLREFLMDIYEDFILKLKNEEKTLHIDIPEEKIIIEYDLNQLKRVIINLIWNAIKFIEPKKWVIELKIKFINEKQILFTIKDNWKWIAETDKDDIFVKFKQVWWHMKRTSNGTWIGLSIVKTILEQIWSHIELTSSVWVGSEFSFKLNIK